MTALYTSRQINIESLNVTSSSSRGVHKYSITAWTDKETMEKEVEQAVSAFEENIGAEELDGGEKQ